MKTEHEFLMPDYYPAFSCKMGACRCACCDGWPISVTMADYFKLLGTDCSPELRGRLDRALHLAPHPTPEAYAQILPRYDGCCPLRLADGRCGLQAELGEEALSAVCRLYPRGVHIDTFYECSCANSCEAVLELLLQKKEPMTFIRREMTFDLPEGAEKQHLCQRLGREEEVGLRFVAMMQDRTRSLPQRILALGTELAAVEEALKAHDMARLEDLLAGRETHPLPETPAAQQEQLVHALQTTEAMLEMMEQSSDSIRAYAEEVLDALAPNDLALYLQAKSRFEALLPNWEIWFEHMMVNHMFFTRFPLGEPAIPLGEKFLSLCAAYLLVRFLCIGRLVRQNSIDAVVDTAAAAFRLIEHSDFDRYAARILKKIEGTNTFLPAELLCI